MPFGWKLDVGPILLDLKLSQSGSTTTLTVMSLFPSVVATFAVVSLFSSVVGSEFKLDVSLTGTVDITPVETEAVLDVSNNVRST